MHQGRFADYYDGLDLCTNEPQGRMGKFAIVATFQEKVRSSLPLDPILED